VPQTLILWLRRDFRLTDNPALVRASRVCERVAPLYIHAPEEEGPRQPGAASRWWLHWSLSALDVSLSERGSGLVVRSGDSLEQLRQLATTCGATHIFWNRLYEPAAMARDTHIQQTLSKEGWCCESFDSALLFEPWELATAGGKPYRVFSAFWRKGAQHLEGLPSLPGCETASGCLAGRPHGDSSGGCRHARALAQWLDA
jgi:deoxyribodipyrimidine photo-lyase